MEITMADSTNDLYQLQVSPLASSSEGGQFCVPSLASHRSVGWRPGGGMKGCLGGSGETQVVLMDKPDGFGGLELPDWPAYGRAVPPAEGVARGWRALKRH